MKLETELGEIRISSDVFTTVTGSAAMKTAGSLCALLISGTICMVTAPRKGACAV